MSSNPPSDQSRACHLGHNGRAGATLLPDGFMGRFAALQYHTPVTLFFMVRFVAWRQERWSRTCTHIICSEVRNRTGWSVPFRSSVRFPPSLSSRNWQFGAGVRGADTPLGFDRKAAMDRRALQRLLSLRQLSRRNTRIRKAWLSTSTVRRRWCRTRIRPGERHIHTFNHLILSRRLPSIW